MPVHRLRLAVSLDKALSQLLRKPCAQNQSGEQFGRSRRHAKRSGTSGCLEARCPHAPLLDTKKNDQEIATGGVLRFSPMGGPPGRLAHMAWISQVLEKCFGEAVHGAHATAGAPSLPSPSSDL